MWCGAWGGRAVGASHNGVVVCAGGCGVASRLWNEERTGENRIAVITSGRRYGGNLVTFELSGRGGGARYKRQNVTPHW